MLILNLESLHHLQNTLTRIDAIIREAVSRVQASGQNPNDALRGLVLSWEETQAALESPPMHGLWGDAGTVNLALALPDDTPDDLPFLTLLHRFDLTPLDAYILLLTIAPELDRRYERVYAFLQDDLSQRRPTINLLMNLLGGNLEQRYAVYERLQADAPLLKQRLIYAAPNSDKPNAARLGHLLGVDARVIAHLLGDDTPDERIRRAIMETPAPTVVLPPEVVQPLRDAVAYAPLYYFKGRREMGQLGLARTLADDAGLPLVCVDAARLASDDSASLWGYAFREAALNGAALLVDNWPALLDDTRQPAPGLWAWLEAYPRPVFLCGPDAWEPQAITRTRRMLRANFSLPPYTERYGAWVHTTRTHGIQADDDTLVEISSKFRLSREAITRAVNTAVDIAASHGRGVTRDDLVSGVGAQINLQLGHLAERITPRFTWDDLILPPDQLTQLREIVERARFAPVVQEQWGFQERIANGIGVSALFAGESGTGKTLAVQVIANALGLALYRIDLSAVVSKYIGETEKNLSTIFAEARSSNAILFFDEADAIFGKRSEVKDARDRYANIEIAYLLQQIEDYDGVAIMATNLRHNLDEAFTRRLDFLVDFPFPDTTYREKLWAAHFPPQAPLDPAVDMLQLAERYRLAGGNIRNAALASAYLAAADGQVITWEHIRNAIRREHQKMGRLLDEI